jgi:hypothetical protein
MTFDFGTNSTDGGLHNSGYASLTSTPDSKPTAKIKVGLGGRILQFSRTPSKEKILPFPTLEIDQPIKERFMSMQPRFERLLLEHVKANQRTGTEYKPMSTRLVMMGLSIETATAHIVVFCQPHQQRLIKRFLSTTLVKELCESSDPGVPSFKSLVVGQAPVLRT